MFKAEIPFSNVMNCEDGDKVQTLSVLTSRGKRANRFGHMSIEVELGWPYVPEENGGSLGVCVCVCVAVCFNQNADSLSSSCLDLFKVNNGFVITLHYLLPC